MIRSVGSQKSAQKVVGPQEIGVPGLSGPRPASRNHPRLDGCAGEGRGADVIDHNSLACWHSRSANPQARAVEVDAARHDEGHDRGLGRGREGQAVHHRSRLVRDQRAGTHTAHGGADPRQMAHCPHGSTVVAERVWVADSMSARERDGQEAATRVREETSGDSRPQCRSGQPEGHRLARGCGAVTERGEEEVARLEWALQCWHRRTMTFQPAPQLAHPQARGHVAGRQGLSG